MHYSIDELNFDESNEMSSNEQDFDDDHTQNASANTTESTDSETKTEKTIIDIEPCDKKATLYLMQKKESGTTK